MCNPGFYKVGYNISLEHKLLCCSFKSDNLFSSKPLTEVDRFVAAFAGISHRLNDPCYNQKDIPPLCAIYNTRPGVLTMWPA